MKWTDKWFPNDAKMTLFQQSNNYSFSKVTKLTVINRSPGLWGENIQCYVKESLVGIWIYKNVTRINKI